MNEWIKSIRLDVRDTDKFPSRDFVWLAYNSHTCPPEIQMCPTWGEVIAAAIRRICTGGTWRLCPPVRFPEPIYYTLRRCLSE